MSLALSLRRSARHVIAQRNLRALFHNPITLASPPSPCSISSRWGRPFSTREMESGEFAKYAGYALLLVGCGVATYYTFPYPAEKGGGEEEGVQTQTVSNWSGTHEVEVDTKRYLQPESVEELERIVREAHAKGIKLRPVGSGLSPNGIGLSGEGMINMALMDKILDVDVESGRVRVQAGVRVSQLVDELRSQGLTMQNFASIREQQLGGIIQVGAHGTGARLPPVDEQVVGIKLVTPAKGTMDLSADKNPELFYLARCGLGGLGIVAEITLQCVPRHQLVEHTFVSNVKEVRKKHKKWLVDNKHLRYMWIPYTDTIVVVQCNPFPEGKDPPKFPQKYGKDEALKHVRDLYKELERKHKTKEASTATNNGDKQNIQVLSSTETDVNELSFTELRDKLISLDPLNKDHVMRVNMAEAEYWKKSEGYRVGWSDEILGFDCGGQQWVSEICFPVGTLTKPNLKDINYVEELIKLIKNEKIPAPAPIEQRWTASSRSLLSPASSSVPDALFSWVGIIMYMPTMETNQRKAITAEFFKYRLATQRQLWDKYYAYEHWAKLEIPDNEEELAWLHERIQKRFPVDLYNRARIELDPNHILSNDFLEKLFPLSSNKPEV
uniref:FAD-binding PCMH-type domain-containing protein n=1 Tax=Araucaria cunninghamii TaxID=56994 RepID=A0A0D6R329_ARACU